MSDETKVLDAAPFIHKTKEFHGMRISVNGVASRCGATRGSVCRSDRWGIGEIARIYYLGKKAWLEGNLEEVAQMFAILD
jgi:hypothetical protein